MRKWGVESALEKREYGKRREEKRGEIKDRKDEKMKRREKERKS